MARIDSETRVGTARVATVAALLLLVLPTTLEAQRRILVPEGTVFTVRTASPLGSKTAGEGQSFRTTTTDSIRVEGFVVIPAGSVVEGRVSMVRQASRERSGVLGLDFVRLVLPDGTTTSIDGELTTTDPAERRRIDAQGDARVVLVGGREGVGAVLGGLGAGAGDDPVAGVLGALGALLSEGSDVSVPAGTELAVRLERGVILRGRGPQTRPVDAFALYTSTQAIASAQRELRARGYYRGAINGRLDDRTRRALLEFQIDRNVLATGNLDGRTAGLLGLELAAPVALTVDEAAFVRREAHDLLRAWGSRIGLAASGRLDGWRSYRDQDLELYFALSAFVDNAGLYEQIVRASGHVEGLAAAGRALAAAAERVDATGPPVEIRDDWARIRAAVIPLASR